MDERLTGSLRKHFGFEAFRPGQAEAIEKLLAARNVLVVMPTGSGKSLIYQLTALLRPGVALVISPLISLMQDQVDALAKRRIPATFINSTLPADEQSQRLNNMAAGEFRLVYVAPERLRSVPFRKALNAVKVGLLAIDEAHCLSQWGHDFRPDYLHIATARKEIGGPLTAAFTATATPRVQDDIVRLLGLPSAERIVTGFNRPNLTFEVNYVLDTEAKLKALSGLLRSLQDGSAIVYVGTRRDAEEVADFVREVLGLKVEHYHGGLDAERRARAQDAFLSGKLPVIVATNAFGMGIDRPDVRLVAHYAMPGTLEAYYQEAGRAGRDGQPARTVLLYSPQDRSLQEWFIENEALTPEELHGIYEALRGDKRPEFWTTTEGVSLATGFHEVKVKVGLAQLEIAGAIERLGDAGAKMLLRVGQWKDEAVRAAAASMVDRSRHKLGQLNQMVSYAESNSCRRMIVLKHFGDKSAADAPECCDNCISAHGQAPTPQGSGPLSQSEKVALLVLDALRKVKWEIGRGKLARLLRGSRAKEMDRFGYNKHPHYGKLGVLSQDEVEGLIDQLIEQGYIKLIGGRLPVMKLTPRGEAALKTRARIPLSMREVIRRSEPQAKRWWRLDRRPIPETDPKSEIPNQKSEIESFLSSSRPRPLKGPWHSGWALGFHSSFTGSDWSRSNVGQMTYRMKYQSDRSMIQPLVGHALAVISKQPELCEVDALVPIPPCTRRSFDPVTAIAEALGARLKLPVSAVLTRTRRTAPQKEMHSLAQKHANVAGAFVVQGNVRGMKVLLLDDLYDSGATLEEAARVLERAGASRICVLTLTRTIHSDA